MCVAVIVCPVTHSVSYAPHSLTTSAALRSPGLSWLFTLWHGALSHRWCAPVSNLAAGNAAASTGRIVCTCDGKASVDTATQLYGSPVHLSNTVLSGRPPLSTQCHSLHAAPHRTAPTVPKIAHMQSLETCKQTTKQKKQKKQRGSPDRALKNGDGAACAATGVLVRSGTGPHTAVHGRCSHWRPPNPQL